MSSLRATLIADRKKHGESRHAQARRLAVSEPSLRWWERNDQAPENPVMRAHLFKGLRITEARAGHG
jgi:DNA-binding transcriptional regulator YiaG